MVGFPIIKIYIYILLCEVNESKFILIKFV